nr:MAG TPA: hypothetical protein [Caudoviricetes sp.]
MYNKVERSSNLPFRGLQGFNPCNPKRGCEIIELKQSPKRCLTQTSQTPFSVVL